MVAADSGGHASEWRRRSERHASPLPHALPVILLEGLCSKIFYAKFELAEWSKR